MLPILAPDGASVGAHQAKPGFLRNRSRFGIGTFQPHRRLVLGSGLLPAPPGEKQRGRLHTGDNPTPQT